MARTRVEIPSTTSTISGVTFTMSASWSDFADANASGGHFEFAAPGQTCSIAVPVGKTAALLAGLAVASAATARVTVDGVVEGTWTLWNGTTNASSIFNIYRTTYHPIALDPATTHTILVTILTGSFNIDCIDLFVADATILNPTVLLTQGDSKAAGGQGTVGTGPYVSTTTRFGGRAAAAFGLTETNLAVVGESLSFFSNPSSSPTVPDTTSGALGFNGGFPSGWQRIDAYTYTVASGAFAGTYNTWEAASPAIALMAWGVNDMDFSIGSGADPNVALGITPLYYISRFQQRVREACWRMMLSCPKTLLVVSGVPITIDTTVSDATKQLWNAGIAAVCAEATMQGHPLYVDVWPGLANAILGPPRMIYISSPATPTSHFFDAIHPNAQGHAIIAESIIAAIRARRTPPLHRLGTW